MSFQGYAIHDTKKWHDFKKVDFESKRMEDYDVEVAITYCGVCGSDVHTITGGWGEIIAPLITGHEISGKVVKVGPKVTEFKAGDRVGVGAQVWSCMNCGRCKSDNENYCPQSVDTYNCRYPHTNDIAHGGYSTGIRAHQQFVFPLPDNLEDKYCSPLMCAGLTVWSPLVRHGAGQGKKVGIIGLGGLGHLAVMLASTGLGSKVTVFSHSTNKKEDALKMGAEKFVNTSDKDWTEQAGGDFDLILSTRDVADGFPLEDFLGLLGVQKAFISVGLPDTKLPGVMAQSFAGNGCVMGGSHIGSKKEVVEMLKICAEKGIKPWIQEFEMKDASEAVQSVKNNTVRYRAVLKQDISPNA